MIREKNDIANVEIVNSGNDISCKKYFGTSITVYKKQVHAHLPTQKRFTKYVSRVS